MARLAPVREELLRGDYRSLYIGWLAGVTRVMMDDEDIEPLPSAGLGNLTTAQLALAEFLEVDADLLAGAGIGSPAQPADTPSQQEMDDWLDNLPHDAVHAILKQLIEGHGVAAERTLKNRFWEWRRRGRGENEETPRRSVKTLIKNSKIAKKARLKAEKREQELREIKCRGEREDFLTHLTKNFPKAWKNVERSIERGSGLGYDEACNALVDISEAYAFQGRGADFKSEMTQFMAAYLRRKALIQRLEKAGIWSGT
jgi:hypothetical protein